MPAGRDTNSNDSRSLRCRIFIGNLATDKTNKKEIEDLFAKYGVVSSCSLHNNFGFVQYELESSADEAVIEMHGKTLFGKRIDVNLAGIRRKPQSKDKYEAPPRKEEVVPENMMKAGAGSKQPHPPSSGNRARDRSPHRSTGSGSGTDDNYPPRPLSPMSRYEELYRRDDPYGRERYRNDDRPPYEYNRDYPPARDPYHFDRRDEAAPPPMQYSGPPMDDNYGRPPPLSRSLRPAIDCEILSLVKEESRYAEEVEARLRSIGLVCNIGYPRDDIPVIEIIDRIARTGTLYAVVVTEQNAQHRSCTLNVLNGPRQEHRNMPLDDALSFIARNFDAYLKSLREQPPHVRGPPPPTHYYPPRDDSFSRGPPPPPVHHMPPPPASSGNVPVKPDEKKLSNDELNEMIEKLKREKEEREGGKLIKDETIRSELEEHPPTSNGQVTSDGYYNNYRGGY